MASVIDQRTGAEGVANGTDSPTSVTTERLRSLAFAKGTDQGPKHREPMSPRRRRTRYMVLAALLLAVIGYGFTRYKGILRPVVDVDVVAAESELSTVTLLDTSGYLMAKTKVQVNSKVPGTIVELPIEEGMEVKAGDLLARLEGGEYAADLAAAKAGLAHSKAQLSELEAGPLPEEVQQAESILEQANARAGICAAGL